MKTYFLDQGEFIGGAECFLIDFFNSLTEIDQRQIDPIIIGAISNNYKDRLKNKNIKILDFAYPQVSGGVFAKLLHIVKFFNSASKLKKLIKTEKQRKFFSNTPRTHFVVYLAKVFFHIRGEWIVMFHDFTIPKFLVRRIAKTADVLIANSMTTRNYLRKTIPKSCYEKIRIVENGINFEEIPPEIISQKIEKILVLGRIDRRKGQLYALDVAKKLQDQQINCQFDFVGEIVEKDIDTSRYLDKCKRFAEDEKLKNIQFLPEINEVFTLINTYDLVLFLPTEPETFGRVVTESLAMGKMILSFNQTGPREILQNFYYFLGRNGVSLSSNPFLVPMKDSDKLMEEILKLIKNPERVYSICTQARPFIEKNYNQKETQKRLLDIL